ncbi:MAG: TlpA disulfide reductase family protein [Candidatus Saganbacteria bacterium]|nr:TlpA disulfide reductase family protein [Candidatus Saganbacteria bacterium]
MKRIFAFILIFSLLIVISFAMSEKGPSGGTAKKTPAPDFKLKDVSGHYKKLSDFKGKIVLLNFFATWCPPCRAEMSSMERLNNALSKKDFKMIAVSIDRTDTGTVKAFIEKGGYSFLVLHDKDNAVSDIYGIYSIPTTFIIDKKGKIAQKIIGGREWDLPEVIGNIKSLIKE